MNKRGVEEKYLSIWNMFAIIFLLAVVVIGLYLNSSREFDVRGEEAKAIALKLRDCMIDDNGYLKEAFYADNLLPDVYEKADIFEECALNEKMFEENRLFYAKAEFLDADGAEEVFPGFDIGNGELDSQCQIKKSEQNLAVCYEEKIHAYDGFNKKDIMVLIRTASNNMGEK